MGQAPSSPLAAASGAGDGEGGCAETASGAEPPSCAVPGCGAVARAMGWFAGSAPAAAIHRFPLSCNPYRFGEKIFPRRLRSAYSYPDPLCHAGGSCPAQRSFPRAAPAAEILLLGSEATTDRRTPPESDLGAAQGLEEAGDQGIAQPASAHENCFLGSKSLPAPRPSTDLSCSAPSALQIFKAELYLHPAKAISINVSENKPQPKFEKLLQSN